MLHYSTDDVHPRDRLSYWREVVTRTYVKHSFRTGVSFEGTLRAGALADLGISTMQCGACVSERGRRDIARDNYDDMVVCVPLVGSAVWEQNGRQATVHEGSFVLMDTGRPFSVTVPVNTHSVSLVIPRRTLEARLGETAGLTARALDGRRPVARLASRLLAMLPECLEGLEALQASKLAEHMLDMVALAISDETHRQGLQLSSTRAVALARLRTAIGNGLCDPEFKPSDAAAASGMSVRYANALLSEQGTSVERYIMTLRLDRCRRALEDRAQKHRTIADIAFGWGFSDISHFCRRFKAEFGCSPREYREQRSQEPKSRR